MRLTRQAILVGLGLASVTIGGGCNAADRIAGPRDFRQLGAAEERWHSRTFADYSYEVRSACYCPPEMQRWTRVSVHNNRVIGAVPVTPDPFFPNNTLRYWEPVDSVFVALRRVMNESGPNSLYSSVVARFDPEFGYPVSVVYEARSAESGAGGTQLLRNLRPLE